MSILNISDIHFGCKQHSNQLNSGFVSTEEICINILNQILEVARKENISLITITGDICHTNHPTTLVSDYLIKFFKELDQIGKPVVVIPGNHDKSNYSYSFIFLRQLQLSNVVIFDDISADCLYQSDLYPDVALFFIPFVISSDAVDKYQTVKNKINDICTNSTARKIIIFSHLKESMSQIGSEAALVSKSVEDLDLNTLDTHNKEILFVLGHMHMYQSYTKQNGVKVLYAGCPYPMDKTDCNQQKGVLVIDPKAFTHEFVPLKQPRLFAKVSIPSNTTIADYFKGRRIPKNTFFFVEKDILTDAECESDTEVNKILAPHNSKCESVKYIRTDIKKLIVDTINITTINSDSILDIVSKLAEEFRGDYSEEEFKIFKDTSIALINSAVGDFNSKKDWE